MNFGSDASALASCGRRAIPDFFLGTRCPVHMHCFASANGVTRRFNVMAQQSGFLVAFCSKLPLPFPVHRCSFFAVHL
jgi:hypothetical protein